jgi:hypothetical protein
MKVKQIIFLARGSGGVAGYGSGRCLRTATSDFFCLLKAVVVKKAPIEITAASTVFSKMLKSIAVYSWHDAEQH